MILNNDDEIENNLENDDDQPKRLNSHGGYRRGAGKPKGSTSGPRGTPTAREKRATKSAAQLEEIQAALRDAGIDMHASRFATWSPIDVMQYTMQYYFAISQRANDPDTVLQNLSKAAAAARDLAPYVSPRLQSVDVNATLNRDPSSISDEELLAIVEEARRKA